MTQIQKINPGLIQTYYQKMFENHSSNENLKITPENVFQPGNPRNYNLFIELVDELMLTGSQVRGVENLSMVLSLLKQNKSVLFLMKHLGNFDVPCFFSLVSREGKQYNDILNRLVFIAGRKLNEDSLIVKTFSEVFSRLVIVPLRDFPQKKYKETPEEMAYRKSFEAEATRINRAAFRKMVELKKTGHIIVLFPEGGRPKPWLKEELVRETTSYMKHFDYINFISMNGNILPVGQDMKDENPCRDKIVFSISEPIISKNFLEESNRLFAQQTEIKDFALFNVKRVMVEISRNGSGKS